MAAVSASGDAIKKFQIAIHMCNCHVIKLSNSQKNMIFSKYQNSSMGTARTCVRPYTLRSREFSRNRRRPKKTELWVKTGK
jgi:hypothetical protein